MASSLPKQTKRDIYSLTPEDLRQALLELGESPHRYEDLFREIYRKHQTDFREMESINKRLANKLEDHFRFGHLKEIHRAQSLDGTVKFLLELEDGNLVECVVLHYRHGATLCLSTQKGCRMGCGFCASTKARFAGNLTAGEIVEQVLFVEKREGVEIENIVYMGIGEPLDNPLQVKKSLEILTEPFGRAMAPRKLTVSTCGVVPQIYALADEKWPCSLAVSLHFPDDETRSAVMPINRIYPIEELMKACRYYSETTNKRIAYEVAIIQGTNDSLEVAQAFVDLLSSMDALVNLIPINEIEETEYKQSDYDTLLRFKEYLRAHGVNATIRRSLGQDIEAACGQLRKEREEKRSAD